MVAAPEDVQQLLVGDDSRVEIDLDGLGVVAEVVVGGVVPSAACIIPYPGADNPVNSPELGIWTPESPQSEGSRLHVSGNRGIQGRDLNLRGAHSCLHESRPFLKAFITHGLAWRGGGNVATARALSRSANH